MLGRARVTWIAAAGVALLLADACALDERTITQTTGNGDASAPGTGGASAGVTAASAAEGSGGPSTGYPQMGQRPATTADGGNADRVGAGGASPGVGVGGVDSVATGGREPEGGASGSPDATPGAAGQPEAACVLGDSLIIDGGWVDARSNCAGVQGMIWVDWLTGFIVTTSETGDWCMEGFGDAFDVSAGLYLNQSQWLGPVRGYNALAHGVTGVSFMTIGGPFPYFGVKANGSIYCAPLTTSNVAISYAFHWTDLHANCWDPGGDTPDPTALETLGFFSGPEDSESFQFCVKDLTAIRDPG